MTKRQTEEKLLKHFLKELKGSKVLKEFRTFYKEFAKLDSLEQEYFKFMLDMTYQGQVNRYLGGKENEL
jgi:hypothetical protein